MADLKGKSEEFGGKIIGIEPGAGEMNLLKTKVMPGYGLDKEYQLVTSSTSSMLSELKRDYAQKKPVAVVLWSPHWAYSTYELTKLTDPKGCGAPATPSTTSPTRTALRSAQVTSWMKNFHMTEAQLGAGSVHPGRGPGQHRQGVQNWMKKNPAALDSYVPVPGRSGNVGKGATVKIGNFNWDESIASSYLWQAVLERRGYKVQNNTSTRARPSPAWRRTDFDFITDAWLPTTHASYMKQYGKDYTETSSKSASGTTRRHSKSPCRPTSRASRPWPTSRARARSSAEDHRHRTRRRRDDALSRTRSCRPTAWKTTSTWT